MSASTYQAMNEKWMQHIQSDDPVLVKNATDAVNDFIRVRLREDSFFDNIIGPVNIPDSELDRQIHTDKPVKIVDKEPNSPAAISIPFGTLPNNVYIRGPKIGVGFDRIVTPRFTKDINELRTYRGIDIRQVLSDNAIKDLSAEKDGKFIQACISILAPSTGAAGETISETGVIQWQEISGGITRETVAEAKKIMTTTPSRLRPATALINQTTAIEFEKWDRTEVGGDLSEEILKRGWAEREWFGMRFIVTIKNDLVPTNSMYLFAAPAYLGKNYVLDDVTMYIRREFYLLEFFAYMTIGGVIGNTAGVARVDFV